MKNDAQHRKPHFQPMGLIFYCYLLITLNELAPNTLNVNYLKIAKKIIVLSMVSIQNTRKGVFGGVLYPDTPLASARPCHSDGPLFRGESGLREIESLVTL